MGVPWLALATGGGALADIMGQKDANAQNLKIAREQMRFQERMSNTAYSRAARDLENAGLNRILALGNPASSPQGASATMLNPFKGMATTAKEVGLVAKNAKILDAQAQLINEQARGARYQADITAPDAAIARGKMYLLEKGGAGAKYIMDNVPTLSGIASTVDQNFKNQTKLDWGSMWDRYKTNIGSMWDQLKREIQSTRYGASNAKEVPEVDKKVDAFAQEFQKQTPTRQEQSSFNTRYNELAQRGWDEKRIMWSMYQEFKGRWPDWAVKKLYDLYPKAIPPQ